MTAELELLHRALFVWINRLEMWRSPEDIDLCNRQITYISNRIAFF